MLVWALISAPTGWVMGHIVSAERIAPKEMELIDLLVFYTD